MQFVIRQFVKLACRLLAMWALAPALPIEAQGFSLRLFGHGVNDIDRVKIPLDAPARPVDVGATDFTIEWWMKATPGQNGSTPCMASGDNWINGNIVLDRDVYNSGDYGDYGVSVTGDRLAFGVNNGSTGMTICGTAIIADAQWHHVAVTRRRSDGLLRLFIDGALDAQADGPDGDVSYRDGRATGFEDDPFLVIGAEKHDVGAPGYRGWIDELRVSTTLRYAGPFTRPNAAFGNDASTAALYHFDAGPAGPCTGAVTDSATATGGPSNGVCNYGGSAPEGPIYSADTPFGVVAPATATPTPPLATHTPTRTATRTPTRTATRSATATATRTRTPTPSPTATIKPPSTHTPTVAVATTTATQRPSDTVPVTTSTPTPSERVDPTATPSSPPTATATTQITATASPEPTTTPSASRTPSATSTPGVIPGDLNGDLRVDADDLPLLITAIYLGNSVNADVNSDGRVTAADITELLRILE